MTHRYIKIGVTALVLVLAFAGLLWSTLREGAEYYKHVDEVMASPDEWEGKRLQLHGFVVANSILTASSDTLEYKFKVQNNGHVDRRLVQGHRAGHVQGHARREAEVVLKGQLTQDGFHVEQRRRDGQVSVQVRGSRRRSAKWPRSARFSCSRRSSSAATPPWPRWPARGAARGA